MQKDVNALASALVFDFQRKQRLKCAAEFDNVFKTGKRFSLSCFALCIKPTGQPLSRLGLMIGKKHCRLAVKRNRLKRVARDYFRLNQSRFPKGDIVVLLRSTTDNMTDQEQVTCLKSLFEQCIAQFDGAAFN